MKSCHRRRRLLILLALVLFSVNFAVLGGQADRYFEIGVRAAQQQQYHVALKAFLQAKSSGLETPELTYNLGVIYYKLSRYHRAAESFRQLIHNADYSAIAFYNLGLVELKLGKTETSKDWFLKANSTTSDPKLKKLSEVALHRVNADHPTTDSPLTGWSGFVAVGAGYDNNVSLIDEDVNQTGGKADFNKEVSATTSRMLWGTLNKGIQLTASAEILEQETQHRYDFSQWHIGLTHLGVLSDWKTSAGAGIDRLRSANAAFQQLASLEFRAVRRITKQTGLELGYSYVNIEDQSPNGIYRYLEGNVHQFRLKLTDKWQSVGFKYLYEIQINDRNNYTDTSTTPTTTESYSPLRNIFQVTADMPVRDKLALVLGAQYRYSYYSDADTKLEGSTTVYSLQREDHRYKVNMGVQYAYRPKLQFFSHYSFTRNVSNRQGTDYRRSLISAGVMWLY